MKKRTIRGSLLWTCTVVIVVSFFALAVLFSVNQGLRTRDQTMAVLRGQTRSAAAAVDGEIDRMRTMAMNISYSTRVQDQLNLRYSVSRSEEAAKLSTILSVIIFPNRPIDQINLYTRDGLRVSSGLVNGISEADVTIQPWYDDLVTGNTRQRIFYSGPDEALSKFATDRYGKLFVTLVMELYDNFGSKCGFVEIRQRVSRIAASVAAYTTSYGESLYLFDRDGCLIYPQIDTGPDLSEAVQHTGFPAEFTVAKVSGKNLLLCAAPCGGGRFYTVMCISRADLFRPVLEQITTILLLTLGTLVLAIFLSQLAARRITAPINTICERIGGIDIEHPAALPELKTNIIELQTLYDTFVRMQSSLSEHVSKLLQLQNQEMQSRMLALQAQMNPHFLFNSLQAVQAMADEGMNDEIGVMCQSMANILRYISSDSAQLVPLEDEIRYTTDYLRCMEIRYQGDLESGVDIPDSMKHVRVPKLCVQLLVENAIKFTTTLPPPYRINISGTVRDGTYELRIRDNGPGFGSDTLEVLNTQMDEIRRTRTLPSLKINGMGLLHVFIRFCLLYDNKFTFRTENNPEGGACVLIGADIDDSQV